MDKRRRRYVWIVALARYGFVVEVALRPTKKTADQLANAWRRAYPNDAETDVAVFRRVLPMED